MTNVVQTFPAGIYLFKVNNENTRANSEICSKLTKRDQNNVNKVILVSLLLTSNIFKHCSNTSTVDFEQVNAGYVDLKYALFNRVKQKQKT